MLRIRRKFKQKKSFEENITRVENEQVFADKKTELTLYWIGEKSFAPFPPPPPFTPCPYSLLCLLLSS
jgi:hypothetical protein